MSPLKRGWPIARAEWPHIKRIRGARNRSARLLHLRSARSPVAENNSAGLLGVDIKVASRYELPALLKMNRALLADV